MDLIVLSRTQSVDLFQLRKALEAERYCVAKTESTLSLFLIPGGHGLVFSREQPRCVRGSPRFALPRIMCGA